MCVYLKETKSAVKRALGCSFSRSFFGLFLIFFFSQNFSSFFSSFLSLSLCRCASLYTEEGRRQTKRKKSEKKNSFIHSFFLLFFLSLAFFGRSLSLSLFAEGVVVIVRGVLEEQRERKHDYVLNSIETFIQKRWRTVTRKR